jgi:hypothetical protein
MSQVTLKWKMPHVMAGFIAISSVQSLYSVKKVCGLKCHCLQNVHSSAGEIIGCHTNCPGSWHDSCVAEGIYEKLECDTPGGYSIVAFPTGYCHEHKP